MIRVAIRGKSKTLLNHLSGKPAPPEPDDDKYEQWEQNDLIVFSWLIQNIEPALASNLTEFPTAKSLWDALVVTYSSGKDNLTRLATTGTPETEGLGFLSRRRFGQTKSYNTSSSRIDKSKLKCNHCGMTKHMKDQCFKLVGFPEWWNDGHKKRKNLVTEGGKTVAAVGNLGVNDDNSGATRNNNEPRSEGFGGIASARFGEFGADPINGVNRTGEIIGRGTERQGLYYVEEVTQHGNVMLAHGSTDREAWLWHRRLGHPSTGYLHLLFPKLFPHNKTFHCETCVLAKSHRQTYKLNNTRVDSPFSLIHSDVWGPAEITGGQNFRYFVLFIDDCTRMTWIYFLKHKYEVFDKFTIFYNMIQTQFKTNIQILRSDNGGEFINDSMKQFCQNKGIIHQKTCPHTPEQNGTVERKNRILLEITRAFLIESQVPTSFWPEAAATATYLINRLPTKALNLKTPIQALSNFTKIPPPLTLTPRVFECSVFPHIPKHDRGKLGPCAEKCVFLGYGIDQKGYRCYSPKRRHMYTTLNCDFLETEFFYTSQHSGQGEKEYIDTLGWLKWAPSPEEINQNTQDNPSQEANHNTQDESLTSNQSSEPIVSAANQDPPSPVTNIKIIHPKKLITIPKMSHLLQINPVNQSLVLLTKILQVLLKLVTLAHMRILKILICLTKISLVRLLRLCRRNMGSQYKKDKQLRDMFYHQESTEGSHQNGTLQKKKQGPRGILLRTLPTETYQERPRLSQLPYMMNNFQTLWNKHWIQKTGRMLWK
ncbi:putative RNA-directed DNA polymerase [Helianthus annuus]|nr:putative RNA-directed DNA polymerase [Helianthus annuus]